MHEEAARNVRRTALVVLWVLALAGGLGFLLGSLLGSGMVGLITGLALACAASLATYRSGHRLILRLTRARRVEPDEQPRLHNLVDGLAGAAGVPKPGVYVVPEAAPNAFAAGTNQERSVIAVTEGLLEKLDRVELEGVLAHEVAHIRDRDALLGTVVASLVGPAAVPAEFLLRTLGLEGSPAWPSGSSRPVAANILMLIPAAVLAPLAMVAAPTTRLAVSPGREYLADVRGALLSRYPPGLTRALRRIAADEAPMRAASNSTAHLWLSRPPRERRDRTTWLDDLFATHPPMEDRIRRLEEM